MSDTTKTPLNETEEAERGRLLAAVLGVRRDKDRNELWYTVWGTKTDLGLFRVVQRIVMDGK